MNKERPAFIIQNDIGNMHSGNTIVIPITHDSSTLPCVANITPQVDSIRGAIILDGQAILRIDNYKYDSVIKREKVFLFEGE